MNYRRVMSRRTLLRGAGAVAIGLPFIDAMLQRSLFAAEPEPPPRVLTVSFGMGIPKQIAHEGLIGPLAPLAALADKLAIVRGIDMSEAHSPINNHLDGGGCVFVGAAPQSSARAGGPSLDQVIKRAVYPDGTPTLIDTLSMGSFFRRGSGTSQALTRYVRSWSEDGSPLTLPIETPDVLFERLFGAPEPIDSEQRRYRRSVLDSVIGQYQHLTSDASNLGRASQARIADHLDRVRELERKVFPDPLTCERPDPPGESPLLRGQSTEGSGPQLAVDEWIARWRLLADLYALAIHCDLARIGSVVFQSAGDRVRLSGEYRSGGQVIARFADTLPHHEYWHGYDPAAPNLELRSHLHLILDQIAYFVGLLDDPEHVDSNGLTVLDNALVVIGTELGNGALHDMDGVFHAVSGANQRFRTGQIFDLTGSSVDLYNTCLTAMGVSERIGDGAAYSGDITSLLA